MSYFNYSSLYTPCSTIFGGGYSCSASAGAFCLAIDDYAASSVSNVCGRLMFL